MRGDGLDIVLRRPLQVLIRRIADEQRNAFGQVRGEAGGEVVDDDNAFAGFHQRTNRVTSDIAGAAGDKHTHELTPLPDCSRYAIREAVKSGFQHKRTDDYA